MPYKDPVKRKEMAKVYSNRWRTNNPEKARIHGNNTMKNQYLSDPDKFKERRKKEYHNNPSKIKEAVYRRRNTMLTWFRDYCSQRNYKCKCRCNNSMCLDFHHTGKKTGLITTSIRTKGWSKKRILAELNQCLILCANCHRMHHSKGKPTRKSRVFIWDYKSTHPCKCGENRPQCLDFHHRSPNEKSHQISDMAANGVSIELIIAEIEKCDILCANCHRIYHNINHISRHGQTLVPSAP